MQCINSFDHKVMPSLEKLASFEKITIIKWLFPVVVHCVWWNISLLMHSLSTGVVTLKIKLNNKSSCAINIDNS